MLKRVLRGLLVLLVVLAAAAVWKREEITRLLAVNSLFSDEKIVQNFSHMDKLFLTRPLSRGDGPVSPLPPARPSPCRPKRSNGCRTAASPGW